MTSIVLDFRRFLFSSFSGIYFTTSSSPDLTDVRACVSRALTLGKLSCFLLDTYRACFLCCCCCFYTCKKFVLGRRGRGGIERHSLFSLSISDHLLSSSVAVLFFSAYVRVHCEEEEEELLRFPHTHKRHDTHTRSPSRRLALTRSPTLSLFLFFSVCLSLSHSLYLFTPFFQGLVNVG